MRRRTFLKSNLVAGAALIAPPVIAKHSSKPEKKVKIGLIGVGLRGTSHLRNLLKRKDVLIPAICDIDPDRIKIALDHISKAGFQKPQVYSSPLAYLELLKRADIEAVLISTPWELHTPMAVAAMKAGKRPGVEVAAANTLEECWDLVNVSEQTGVPCMILENACYRRDVMAILNMVRKGVFGEILHCRCGYLHDLREVKFRPGVEFGEKGLNEARWRTNHSIHRNGDLYPTHGIGPVAHCLNINRGNRFVSLTSVATKARGLHDYIVRNGGVDHPNAKTEFKLGDVVSTLITTQNGETVLVTHDTNLPRPYSLGFQVQGTNGLWMNDANIIHLEGKSPKHKGEAAEIYLNEYDHPLWKRYETSAEGSGHGGQDFFNLNAFVESVKRQVDPPMDVYDAATWSAISELSERSIATGGAPQLFPDFTRGRWMSRKPVFALTEDDL